MDNRRSVRSTPSPSSAAASAIRGCRVASQPAWTGWRKITALARTSAVMPHTNTEPAVPVSQPRRLPAIQATAISTPSSARMAACGASPMAVWMKAPPGTCNGYRNVAPANATNV
jgi:hypothetical protein